MEWISVLRMYCWGKYCYIFDDESCALTLLVSLRVFLSKSIHKRVVFLSIVIGVSLTEGGKFFLP